MEFDSFKKIIKNPSTYLPTILLFFVLSQTNKLIDLIMLFAAFLFLLFQERIILTLVKFIDKKKVSTLLQKNKKDKALDIILNKRIRKEINHSIWFFALMLLITIFLNVYSLFRLIPLWESHIVKFLLIVSIMAYANKIFFYLRNLSRYLKIELKKIIRKPNS